MTDSDPPNALHQGDRHEDWVGVIAGNSRLHWGYFDGDRASATWDGPHLGANLPLEAALVGAPSKLRRAVTAGKPLFLASVVVAQTPQIETTWPGAVRELTLADVPLQNLYPTLGIDRALAAIGAGDRHGFPVLVIDGGTALTFTGIDRACTLVGGAILPGLRLQWQSLARETSALIIGNFPPNYPARWAQDTSGAIASGILHGAVATLADFGYAWLQKYSDSMLILTGGDGSRLLQGLQQHAPDLARVCQYDPYVGLAGLQHCAAVLKT